MDQKFKFTKQVSKHLNCYLCSNLMVNNPTRLHPCGHVLCFNCTIGESQFIYYCPVCDAEVTKKQKDLLVRNLIDDLATQCLNQDCVWKGTYINYKQFHEKQCGLKDSGGLQQWLKSIQESVKQFEQKKQENEQKQEQIENDKMRVSNKVYIKDVYSHEEGKLNKKNTIIERIKRKKDQDKKDQQLQALLDVCKNKNKI